MGPGGGGRLADWWREKRNKPERSAGINGLAFQPGGLLRRSLSGRHPILADLLGRQVGEHIVGRVGRAR